MRTTRDFQCFTYVFFFFNKTEEFEGNYLQVFNYGNISNH